VHPSVLRAAHHTCRPLAKDAEAIRRVRRGICDQQVKLTFLTTMRRFIELLRSLDRITVVSTNVDCFKAISIISGTQCTELMCSITVAYPPQPLTIYPPHLLIVATLP